MNGAGGLNYRWGMIEMGQNYFYLDRRLFLTEAFYYGLYIVLLLFSRHF